MTRAGVHDILIALVVGTSLGDPGIQAPSQKTCRLNLMKISMGLGTNDLLYLMLRELSHLHSYGET